MDKEPHTEAAVLPAIGALLELELEDLSSRGQGVGRTDEGLVVMVAGGVPGDLVRARVVRLHRNRVDAEAAEILRPAPERVTPRCAHFGACGGCSLQNLDPGAQRAWKTRRLRQLLTRQGRLPGVPVGEAEEVGPAYGYRGRMSFTGEFTAGSLVLGLHDREGKLFPVRECLLPDPAIMTAFAAIRLGLEEAPPEGSGKLAFRLDLRLCEIRIIGYPCDNLNVLFTAIILYLRRHIGIEIVFVDAQHPLDAEMCDKLYRPLFIIR